jgi:hypothetical protein
LHWIAEQHGFVVSHHVDDFVVLTPCGGDAHAALARFRALCARLGVPLSLKKAEGPCTSLVVCGVLVDTEAMTLSITRERRERVLARLRTIVEAKTVTVAELSSAVGRLAFVGRVFPAGRSFYSRALAALRDARFARTKRIRVDDGVRSDCQFWLDFLPSHVGSAAIETGRWEAGATTTVFTDACAHGYGVWSPSRREYVSEAFGTNVLAHALRATALSIPTLELYALVVAAAAFGEHWRGHRVLFRSDCEPVVYAVNRGLSRDSSMGSLLRHLSVLAVRSGFEFRCLHVRGVDNVHADFLSRNVTLADQAPFLDLVERHDRETRMLAMAPDGCDRVLEPHSTTSSAPSRPSRVTPPLGVTPCWGLPF